MHFIFTILLIFSFQCSAAASEGDKDSHEKSRGKVSVVSTAELWTCIEYYESLGQNVKSIKRFMETKDYPSAWHAIKHLAQFVQACNEEDDDEEEGEFPYGVDLDAEEDSDV